MMRAKRFAIGILTPNPVPDTQTEEEITYCYEGNRYHNNSSFFLRIQTTPLGLPVIHFASIFLHLFLLTLVFPSLFPACTTKCTNKILKSQGKTPPKTISDTFLTNPLGNINTFSAQRYPYMGGSIGNSVHVPTFSARKYDPNSILSALIFIQSNQNNNKRYDTYPYNHKENPSAPFAPHVPQCVCVCVWRVCVCARHVI